ncbi:MULTISPECIES: type VII secretion protein EccB [Mycobacterium]|uniref:Type VII secretion protein EccB n=5 Tax=Mycobacterium TaxID=1763 RepID=A0AAW5S506_MYCBC|nr:MULTISPECIES: type VII secretion protein EccB [Mycobacterium]MCV6989752.1 type VII secretion protein EccB [Mycobacterium bouchedurhonense]MCV6996692.1 type VII secretion protein EccB [Mycobacterium timonense]MDA3642102.1 type VII secretion protein EccB [Mycobacterium xenopi]MDA3659987.1 type VII secretion protein EccB [Mycobacterium xenopi]MDA3664561.1 type VII secretion protein EccB [Mycobacterium xenopi]
MSPFVPTTKLQVTGHKFLVARLNHALTRFDTSMRHDPARSVVQALMAGFMVAALIAGGALALAYFKPQGLRGDARIVQARESMELFVDIDGKLHPAINLVSAQLIAGKPDRPAVVKAAEVAGMPRGPLVGIPGAPGRVFQPAQTDSVWAVCDVINHPGTTRPGVETAVIASDQQQIIGQDPSAARIVQGPDGATWLLNGGMRHRINVADSALVLGLGLQRFPTIDTISEQLFNTIPAGRPIESPAIPGAGSPTPYPVAPGVVVGSVIRVPQAESHQWYVALGDGVQPISGVLASVLRNTNAYGAQVAPTVSQDVVAHLPAAAPGLDVSMFPDKPLHSAPALSDPVTCWQWVKRAGEQQAKAALAFLPGLPLREQQQRMWRHELVSRPGVSMYAPPDSGYFVQTTGSDPRSPAKETLWWVSDAGVRYGLAPAQQQGGTSAATALGLSSPLPMPWSVLAILAAGPTLSKSAALIGHDTLPADPAAVVVNEGISATTTQSAPSSTTPATAPPPPAPPPPPPPPVTITETKPAPPPPPAAPPPPPEEEGNP